jgi:hypothetical protein
MKRIDFSPQDIEKIAKLNTEGKTKPEIGAEFGCSAMPIQRVFWENNIEPLAHHSPTKEDYKTVKKLHSLGKSQGEIAKTIGFS